MKRTADVPQLEPVCSRPRTAQADGVHAHKPDRSAQHCFPPPGCEDSEWIGVRQLILRQGSSLALMADVSEWLNRSQEFSEVSFLHLLHPCLSRALRPCKRTVGANFAVENSHVPVLGACAVVPRACACGRCACGRCCPHRLTIASASPFQVDPSADWDKWAARRPGFSLSYYCLIDPSLDGQVLNHCAASFSAAAEQAP